MPTHWTPYVYRPFAWHCRSRRKTFMLSFERYSHHWSLRIVTRRTSKPLIGSPSKHALPDRPDLQFMVANLRKTLDFSAL